MVLSLFPSTEALEEALAVASPRGRALVRGTEVSLVCLLAWALPDFGDFTALVGRRGWRRLSWLLSALIRRGFLYESARGEVS